MCASTSVVVLFAPYLTLSENLSNHCKRLSTVTGWVSKVMIEWVTQWL